MEFDCWSNDVPYFEDDEIDDEEYEQKPLLLRHSRMSLMRGRMMGSSLSSASSSPSYTIRDRPSVPSSSSSPLSTASNSFSTAANMCAVCGDGAAKQHYGVLACYGCKGFFRRTLTGKYRYACRFGNNCVVDKYQRNSCRYCRFNRCLEVGMDPKAVRPDRDLTGKQKVPRVRKRQLDEELLNHMIRLQSDDWAKKLSVDVRILLMQLMNIESKVVKGDESQCTRRIVSHSKRMDLQKSISLREMFESRPTLDGKRTEMRYEPLRMARVEELSAIAHRRAIAAVDWVDSLTEMAEVANTEDKVTLVKSCYSPLTIFNFSARTAQNTQDPDILCLNSHSYVPRKLPPEFNEQNQLSNNLIDRCLNELVAPLRKMNLKEEEIVPLKAIIILDPNAKGMSPESQSKMSELRDRVQDLLFHVVKETHPLQSSSSRFGNLLLLLPTISTLSTVMSENMQFCQAFGGRASGDPLLAEMFGDFKLEDPRISSSVSPPILFENPADISLETTTSPLPDPFSSHGPSVVRCRLSHRADASTQTERDVCLADNFINSFSPSHTLSDSSFPSLLDDLDCVFPSSGSLLDLNNCDDILAFIDSNN